MKKVIIQLVLLIFIFAITAYSQELNPKIFEKVDKSVVVVLTFDKNDEQKYQGSGVVINEKGFIATNYHIFKGCVRVEIKHHDKTIRKTKIVGFDPQKDILIVKIEENVFPPIQIADTNKLFKGQIVYAIGSPGGFENTITSGNYSGKRYIGILRQEFLHFSASISPGSSGGAVVNSNGELIGISTWRDGDGNDLSFAIKVNDILKVEISEDYDSNKIALCNLYFDGINAIDENCFYLAIEYFSECLKKQLENANVYYARGYAHTRLNEYELAILDYTKAININLYFAEALNNRGQAYVSIKDFNNSFSDYNKAININPDYAEAYNNRGNAYSYIKEYNKAISDYNKAININPDYAEAYNNRGNTYSYIEEYNKAISDFTKAIDIDPDFAEAYNNRGYTYSDLEDYYRAIFDYTDALELNPALDDVYNNRGLAYFCIEKYKESIMDYKYFIFLNPNYVNAYGNLGYAYLRLEHYNDAILNFKKVIEKDSINCNAILGLIITNYKLGNIEQSKEYLSQAIQIEPRLKKGISGINELEKESLLFNDDERACLKELFDLIRI